MNDLISRQAAIDAIVNTPSEVQNKNIPLVNQYDGATFRQIEILGIIEALPSAQPEIIRCKDCRNDHWCNIQEAAMAGDNFFCGAAERRTDANNNLHV